MKKIFAKEFPYIKWVINRRNFEKKSKIELKLLNKEIKMLKLENDKLNYKLKSFIKKVEIENTPVKLKNLERKDIQLENSIEEFYIDKINKKLKESKVKNLILTTFPNTTTANVGDAMITESFIKLINKHTNNFEYMTVFRGIDLSKLYLKNIKNIFAPGFSVSNDTYQKNYKLFPDEKKIYEYNFIPFGCSYQHYLPEFTSFDKSNYNNEGINFLKELANKTGPLPCRDELIHVMMSKIGVPSYYSGDLVLFDSDYIGMSYTGLNKIKSVAFSIQHKKKYVPQSIELLTKLREYFSKDVEIFVTFHGAENEITDLIRTEADKLNISCVSLSGNSNKLHFYDNIDLHIGYRLHGHISFLRRRKPSILMIEDARSFGFANTDGTSFGCFNALEDKKINNKVITEVIDFLTKQEKTDFMNYINIFNFIDKLYISKISSAFKTITKQLAL